MIDVFIIQQSGCRCRRTLCPFPLICSPTIVKSHSQGDSAGIFNGFVLLNSEQDVILRDGETIGFTAEQKLPISRSQGVYVGGESLKIEF